MKVSELRALIKESLREINAPAQIDDKEKDQRFAQISARPKVPNLSPEESKEVVDFFLNRLSNDRKQAIANAMKRPCTSCEADLKLPPIGFSHGICQRHYMMMQHSIAQEYEKSGRPVPPDVSNPKVDDKKAAVDIEETLTPQEQQIAAKLHSIALKQGSKY